MVQNRLFCALAVVCLVLSANAAVQDQITNVFVIFLENNSFDHILSTFPGSNNILSNAAQEKINNFPQKRSDGSVYTTLPVDSNNRFPSGQPNQPFNLSTIYNTSMIWPSLSINHRFFLEQYQINGGNMDLYVNFSGAGANGFSFSTFDLTNDYFGQLAKSGTVLDNNFHSAFGGSYLNHQWLICGCTPFWSNDSFPTQYLNKVTQFDPVTNRTVGDAAENFLIWYDPEDNKYYTVNTMHSVNPPVSSNPILPQIPTQTAYTTIGDLLSDAGVSWKWYSGGYAAAMNNTPASSFQFHHQPFTYHSRYASASAPGRLAHLADEADMFNDLAAGGASIPKVTFYKPRGDVNFHPATSRNWIDTQANLKRVVDAIFDSDAGATSLVIITFDENGGYWDHVAPPVIDKWGPGTRVPTILLGNFVRSGHVDSTMYETLSVTKFIEQWAGVNGTVVPAGRATNSFNQLFVQPPPMASNAPQASSSSPKAAPMASQPASTSQPVASAKQPSIASSAAALAASFVVVFVSSCIMFLF